MKIVVTGGAGFIGSHITRMLCDAGYEVIVIDDLSRGTREIVDKRASFFKLDLADQKTVCEVIKGSDAVIHLAGFIEVSESIREPVLFVENNIVNSVKLLEAMRIAGVRKIVFSSSACVYGIPRKLPVSEEDPLGEQVNSYGITKITIEHFCQLYHKLYNFDCIIIRYFNPYGPNEFHNPETHAIPNFIKSVLTKTPIPLYWKGEQVRDFIYVEDLARAHIDVLRLNGCHVFNIGTEVGVKVIEVLRTIFKIVGFEVPINDLGERPGDVPANYASSKKIQNAIGWQPKVSLEEGLRKTIEFFNSIYSSA